MNTTTKVLLAGFVGIIIGAVGVALIPRSDSDRVDSEHQMPNGTMTMAEDMAAMSQELNGKTGDAFDQAFLSEMIVHHQGAVAMAQAALQDAKHQEIKDLAKNIISAQNLEIQQMQQWQASWYSVQ